MIKHKWTDPNVEFVPCLFRPETDNTFCGGTYLYEGDIEVGYGTEKSVTVPGKVCVTCWEVLQWVRF